MSVSHISPSPPRRTTLKADETREMILGAAEHRFAAKGFYPTRLEDIAEDVGITRTAVIYHFQDKETLYNAVLEKLFTQLNDRIVAALAMPAELPERVEAAVEAWLDFAGERPPLMRLRGEYLPGLAYLLLLFLNLLPRNWLQRYMLM